MFLSAVPWLRRLAAGLSPRRLWFDQGSVHVGFMVDKVALGQVSPRVLRFFPRQFHSTCAPLLQKTKKLIIFFTGLHNKPQGCGAPIACAAGPFTTKENVSYLLQILILVFETDHRMVTLAFIYGNKVQLFYS
jgi:hypothetical protein